MERAWLGLNRVSRLSLATSTILCSMVAATPTAADTTIYAYDALGRVVTVSVTGGPNGGRQTSTSFDPADNRSNYTVTGAPNAGFSVSDASVTEGGTASVAVSRAGDATSSMTVNYSASNGSATAPSDYSSASGTLTFAAGETSKAISIATIDDSVYEGKESFGVVLSNPSAGAAINRANAVVSILDNEAVPEFSISNVAVNEGGIAVLTVMRSSITSSAVSVNYATAAGTAGSPADFTATSGTLNFLSGETSNTITVPTVDDGDYEGNEAFTVNLSGPTGGAVITNSSATVSLADNDAAPSFAISNASATEGGAIVFTVTKSGATSKSVSVNYSSSNGSAVEPGDYGALSGALTFAPADTSKSITVSTVNDTTYEAAETLFVYLSGASGGATIATPKGTGTINDNDTMPSLSIANASTNEGSNASVIVTRSGSSDVNSTVSYATWDGTATSADYTGVTGSLTFFPGETTKAIQVGTIANSKFNLSKTFNVTLSAASGATINGATGTVTIVNDDPPPSFSTVTPTSRNEGTAIQFSVVLGGNLNYDTPVSVNYATSSGTATSGVDFTATSGTLTFNPPEVVKNVLVPTTQDSDVEQDETINFTISSPTYGASIVTAQSTGTILNDDAPPSTGPVANTDSVGTVGRCDVFTVNPLANDTDPGGHYPLTLVSVATGTGYSRTISGNSVTFEAIGAGTKNVQYVVANSVGGQATGTITWTALSGPVCGGGGTN